MSIKNDNIIGYQPGNQNCKSGINKGFGELPIKAGKLDADLIIRRSWVKIPLPQPQKPCRHKAYGVFAYHNCGWHKNIMGTEWGLNYKKLEKVR